MSKRTVGIWRAVEELAHAEHRNVTPRRYTRRPTQSDNVPTVRPSPLQRETVAARRR